MADLAVLEHDAADAALADPAFLAEWRDLAGACAWATRFQTPDFLLPWYATYRRTHRPLIVRATDAGGVSGLLLLAVTTNGFVESAGGRQSEYQCWLSLPEAASDFPVLAFRAIAGRLAARPLQLHYLPPDVPLDWLAGQSSAACDVETFPRPIMALSLEEIERTWKKKIKNSRLGQLKSELTFTRLTSAEELGSVLDEIATLYDLRQGSISGNTPFRDDPDKGRFHLELMKQPGLLDVTVLSTGGQTFGAHIGVISRGTVHVGILVHSPFFVRHSPGRTQVLYLARSLASEGVTTLDLTPGDDAWKERFATSHDQVRRLRVFASEAARAREGQRQRLRARLKQVAARAGISPQRAGALAAGFRGKSVGQVVSAAGRRARAMLPHTVELRAYTMDLPWSGEDRHAAARRDVMADLLLFHEQPDSLSRQEFFSAALTRLEQGHHCYTVVEGDRLVHWGWMAEGQDRGFMDEVHQPYTYLPESVALYDFYTHPAYRGRGLYSKTLRQMLGDASGAGHKRAYIFVTADNGPSRKVIEKAGFAYSASLFERMAFKRVTRWRSDGAVESSAEPAETQEETPATSSR